MSEQSAASPNQLKTQNPEIIAQRQRVIDLALAVPEDQLSPDFWDDDGFRSTGLIDFTPNWQTVPDPWDQSKSLVAAPVVHGREKITKWLAIFAKDNADRIYPIGFLDYLAGAKELSITKDSLAFPSLPTSWDNEDAKKFLDLAEELLAPKK
jgi:hypothetical protein